MKTNAPQATIIGHPIAHSLSPELHGFWLKALGLEGSYVRSDVPPEALCGFVFSLKENGFKGANITLPHKEAAFALLKHKDAVAKAVGSVNTIWYEGDRLMGTNTDLYGFLANLDQSAPGWDKPGGVAVVLGAGGAARAVVYGLLKRKFGCVYIINRTREKALKLRSFFTDAVIPAGWDEAGELLVRCDFLVNTTSLGMTGGAPLELELDMLKTSAVVHDIVYTPLETDLLKRARRKGHRIVDGLGMLLHQGVPGFEKWFGVRPEVSDALRRHIILAMKRGV